jgi:hypothetical protein
MKIGSDKYKDSEATRCNRAAAGVAQRHVL